MLQEDMYIQKKNCSPYHINITKSATSLKHPDDDKKIHLESRLSKYLYYGALGK